MSTMAERTSARRRDGRQGRRYLDRIVHVLAWPARAYRARQLLHTLAGLDEHELRDIGLTRQDLRDTSALPFDADPSAHLRRRAEGRRRRC